MTSDRPDVADQRAVSPCPDVRVVYRGPTGARRAARGSALDLRATGLDGETLRAALRPSGGDSAGADGVRATDVPARDVEELVAPSPSRWWSSLADPTDGTPALDRLVAAARTRGHAPPELRRLAAAERSLADLEVETVDASETRRRLAEAGADVERLREEVATIRGRLQARRDVSADTDAVEAELAERMSRLTEAETDRVAAEQAHEAAERRAREVRAIRQRRLRLQDRVANRRRDARRALVDRVADDFVEAVSAVPGDASVRTDPLAVEGDPVAAAFAAVRVADLRAPVLDPTARFRSVEAAAAALDCPVIRC